jgi:hypothetical protein
MSIEVRKLWVWVTAVLAVVSAALLAANGGNGPRIASLVGDMIRSGQAGPVASQSHDGPGEASTAGAAVGGPAR